MTLQLLSGTDRPSLTPSENEEEKGENESVDAKQREDTPHVNGEREVKEDHVAELDSQPVSVTQTDEEVAAKERTDRVNESKAHSQTVATDLHPDLTTEPKPQETAAPESEVQQEQTENSVPERAPDKSADPGDDEPGESLPCEDGQEAVSDRNAAVGEMNVAPPKAFAPPSNPPPPPNALQNISGSEPR